ncbi:MAG: CoA transferase [Candidatus Rokubacteria bacterium]|nr:CoA transferase [Candidatus Rokubacteria bacterium]MBI3106141.1 CoA transferase [Candidatus Rokubacteria bacterium]
MSDAGRPLAGLRVLDFTWAAMGPYAGYLLGGLGAEVIHVGRPDAQQSGRATAALYQELNSGKICVRIDVKRAGGQALVRRMASKADVFLENFRPGVVERLGLGYDDLSRDNARLVMVSASSVGRERTEGDDVGYAPIFCALSGVAHLTGHPDAPPVEIRHPADLTGGAVVVLAALAGLARRRRTGTGCYVDLAAREALLWTLAPALAASQADPATDRRMGNAHARHVPHGVFQCAGQNRWVSIAVGSDEEWRRFCDALGRRELSDDARFATEPDRGAHREEVDRIVDEWASQRSVETAAATLQAARVAAVPSMTNRDVCEDAHIRARGVLDHVDLGDVRRWFATPPWVFAGTPRRLPETLTGAEARRHAFGTVLGLDDATIAGLEADQVIG